MISILLPFALWLGFLGCRAAAHHLASRLVGDTSVYEATLQGPDLGIWIQAGVATLQVVSWLCAAGFLAKTVFVILGLLTVL